jgi:hypothetical protein
VVSLDRATLLSEDVDETLLEALRELGVFLQVGKWGFSSTLDFKPAAPSPRRGKQEDREERVGRKTHVVKRSIGGDTDRLAPLAVADGGDLLEEALLRDDGGDTAGGEAGGAGTIGGKNRVDGRGEKISECVLLATKRALVYCVVQASADVDERERTHPMRTARRFMNCLSAMVVSREKKWLKSPVVVRSSSVLSDSMRERKAVSKA